MACRPACGRPKRVKTRPVVFIHYPHSNPHPSQMGGMGRKLLSIEEMGRVGVGRVQIIHWVCI
jgi:hypothetical protein